MLNIGTLKSFDSTDYRAEVQLAGSMAAYLDNIPVARNIASDQMTVGRHVILAIPGGNPRDACIIAVWDGAAGGGGGGGAGNFLALTDTPASYAGQARKYVRVDASENALEFFEGQTFVPLAVPKCIYRTWEGAVSSTARTATVSSITGDLITLTANESYRFGAWGGDGMNPDNVLLKIADKTKAPVQYAWGKGRPAANQLQVTNASDISSWAANDVITTAYDGASSTYLELDISPLIPDGGKGIFVKLQVRDAATITDILNGSALTKEGVSGTLVWVFCQVSGITTAAYPFTPIQANRHVLLRDQTPGTDTLKTFIVVTAYTV